jgi:hypothetical protein
MHSDGSFRRGVSSGLSVSATFSYTNDRFRQYRSYAAADNYIARGYKSYAYLSDPLNRNWSRSDGGKVICRWCQKSRLFLSSIRRD